MRRNLLRALLRPINPASMLILGIYTIFWGLWVACPWWTSLEPGLGYEYMLSLTNEVGWGLIAVLFGSIITWGVIKPSYRNLTNGACAAAIFWLMLTVFYAIGDWENTKWLTDSIFVVYSCYIWLNLRVNKNRMELSEQEMEIAITHSKQGTF